MTFLMQFDCFLRFNYPEPRLFQRLLLKFLLDPFVLLVAQDQLLPVCVLLPLNKLLQVLVLLLQSAYLFLEW